jgi:hypothetical protein
MHRIVGELATQLLVILIKLNLQKIRPYRCDMHRIVGELATQLLVILIKVLNLQKIRPYRCDMHRIIRKLAKHFLVHQINSLVLKLMLASILQVFQPLLHAFLLQAVEAVAHLGKYSPGSKASKYPSRIDSESVITSELYSNSILYDIGSPLEYAFYNLISYPILISIRSGFGVRNSGCQYSVSLPRYSTK